MQQRKWTMSQKEITRLEVINKYLGRGFNQSEAARHLGISMRHFRRLLKTFKQTGADGLISKRRGQPSNHRISTLVSKQAIDLVRQNYSDFGPTFAHEKLWEYHASCLEQPFSVETLRQWMIAAGLHQSKRRSVISVHQSRVRRPCFGELIQIDGSWYYWLEGRGEPCTLIAFIDDATSQVTAWFFCKAETTFDYMECLKQHVTRYGVPVSIYSDRHSIFSNNSKKQQDYSDPSQFTRALKELGIQPYLANTPQAKGRIERLFQTAQKRLTRELRLRDICTIEQANQFLEQYRHIHNRQFAKAPQDSRDSHRKIPCDDRQLQLILSKKSIRKLSKNLICQHHNIQYLIKTKKPSYVLRGARVTLCELPDGKVVILYKGRELPYTIYQQHPALPPHQDAKTINSAIDRLLNNRRKGHKASTNHPWKRWNPDYLSSTQRK